MDTIFPQFRRYSDRNTYFKIEREDFFIEYKKVGKYYTVSEIECKLFPEKMFLNDLLICSFEQIELINESEYLSDINHWESDLIKY
jgi:hypothetical protein